MVVILFWKVDTDIELVGRILEMGHEIDIFTFLG